MPFKSLLQSALYFSFLWLSQSALANQSSAKSPVILNEVFNVLPMPQEKSQEPASINKATLSLLEQGSSLKMGFINFRTIMVNAPQNDRIRSILEQEFKEEHKALLQEQQDLSLLEQQFLNLETQDPQYEILERQIISKRRELSKRDNQYRDRYSLRRNEEANKVQTLVLNEIIAVAQELKFDVILNDTGVVYVSERADLTQMVLKRLKEKSEE
ncbi:MAG: OmpH family outer membrane protein [Cardiobacteriaceae bacterium]|nr:OmpH family outer membrane protein [Cardiobacteriaceae bacterium]